MLKIRLSRFGKRNDPHYRIVVIPQRTKRDGRAVEYIGYYNPIKKTTKVDTDRAKYWLSVGAMPTDTVRGILVKQKVLKPLPRIEKPAKKPKKEIKAAPPTPKKDKPKQEKKTEVKEQKPKKKKEKTKVPEKKKEEKKVKNKTEKSKK